MNYLFVTSHYEPDGAAVSNVLRRLVGSLRSNGDSVYVAAVFHPESLSSKADDVSRTLSCTALSNRQIKNMGAIDAVRLIAKKIICKSSYFQKGDYLNKELSSCFVASAKKYIGKNIDVVVPVVGELAAADAAITIRNRYWPNAKLIPYLLDPIVERETFSKTFIGERISFEEALFRNSDAVVTTPILRNIKANSVFASKIEAVEFPGIVCNCEQCSNEQNFVSGPLRLVFAGTLFPDIRKPDVVLEAFSGISKEKAQLFIAGAGCEEVVSYWSERSDGSIVSLGKLSLGESEKLVSSADILVNIGNSVTNQLPSKIFDYFSLGKPILNFCKACDCPTLSYMSRYPLAFSVMEASPILQIREQVEQFVVEKGRERISFDEVESVFSDCTPRYVARSFSNIVEGTFETRK